MEVTALHDSLVSDREIAAAPVRLLQPDWSASRASGGRAELSSALPAACVAALDAFASGREVAPLSVLAAAFAALLQRYGGSRLAALALGSRERSWPVALEFDWSCDFAQAVAAVEAASDDARRQARSFDERLARYAFSDAPQVPDGAWERALAACDLHVEFNRARASMRWHYDAALFERETIARFASHFVRLLEGALAAPATALDSITVLDADERERIVALGIGAAPPYERDATIAARFAAQVARYPSRIAAIASDGALRYDELERDSERVAAALYRRGVRAGARVGVAFERSLRLPAALLGILKLGAAYVPLDPSYPRERLEFILADADVSAIVSDGALPAALAHDPGIRLDVAAALGENGALDYPRPHASGDDLAYVIYTSGSTGRPKGVAVPQRAILRLVAPSDWLSLADDETFLQLAPLAFDASTFEMWAPLLNGARLAIAEPGLLSSAELGATIARFGVTTIFLTTTLFERLVDEPNARPECLRRMLTGGEIASPDHMARFLVEFPACRLAAVYGPTENTTFSTWFEIPMKSVLGRSVPIGRPIAHSSAYVVDERLELLPLGAVGQLAVGGDGVALGYLNAPERTAERFVPDPFSGRGRLYLTGDLARCRADGVIEFFGRRDHQVKVRGFRIELGEIEAALQRERAVRDVAVVVAENGREKSLVAFVVAAAGEALDGARLRAALAETLPPYMLPHRIEFLAELPLHPSGKTDRVALAARATSDERARVQAVAGSELAAFDPSDLRAVRALVANEWRSILRADGELSHEANFFDAGGDSLRLLALHARLARFAPALRVVDLFEHVTIRAQAEFIAEAHRATACAR